MNPKTPPNPPIPLPDGLKLTPNNYSANFATASLPLGSSEQMLQASLKDNVVFSDEGIVDAIFEPSKVDPATIAEIMAEIKADKQLSKAYRGMIDGKLAERKKYQPMVVLLEHISDYKHTPIPLQGDDHAHHINRTWLDTHSQAIRVDPGIHLAGHRPRKKDESEGDDVGGDDDDESSEEDEDGDPSGGADQTEDPNLHGKRSLHSRDMAEQPSKRPKTTVDATEVTPFPSTIDDRRPDITMIDCPVNEGVPRHPYGRHAALYFEVKKEPNLKPNPQGVGARAKAKPSQKLPKVKSILTQIADTARLHLATRPFMRYSLHLTLCGHIFNVCLLDRAGAIISKDYDLKNDADLQIFVRVIRRATCDLDAYALGLDPTVTPLDSLASVQKYPRFKVAVQDKFYYTYGLPIWQSTTLHGRGTWVMCVTKVDNPRHAEPFVLKHSWRAPGWIAESKLYDLLPKIPTLPDMPSLRYIANFVEGGDVMIEEGVEMRVSSHRQFVIGTPNSRRDPIAHRVVLGTYGRGLSTYASTVELLVGAKCAAEGLEALYRRGVLHRDVSLGNVLLGLDPNRPFGFIADLDHATVTPEAIKMADPENGDTILSQMKRAEWRTGTAVFKAVRVLSQLTSPRSRDPKFEHKLCHDFESLIWVVVYAMMVKRACLLAEADKTEYEQYKILLDRYWGAHSFELIEDSHRLMVSRGRDELEEQIEAFWFSNKHEAAFFRKSMLLVESQIRNQPITYDAIRQLFDDTINELSSAC